MKSTEAGSYASVLFSGHKYKSKEAAPKGAMHAINRAKLRIGDYVCVGGFGAFGYLLIAFAKLSGATVIVLDDDEQRLESAREHV